MKKLVVILMLAMVAGCNSQQGPEVGSAGSVVVEDLEQASLPVNDSSPTVNAKSSRMGVAEQRARQTATTDVVRLETSVDQTLPVPVQNAFRRLRESSLTVLEDPSASSTDKAIALRRLVNSFTVELTNTGNLTERGAEVVNAYRDEKFESALSDMDKADTPEAFSMAVNDYSAVLKVLEQNLADRSQDFAR